MNFLKNLFNNGVVATTIDSFLSDYTTKQTINLILAKYRIEQNMFADKKTVVITIDAVPARIMDIIEYSIAQALDLYPGDYKLECAEYDHDTQQIRLTIESRGLTEAQRNAVKVELV